MKRHTTRRTIELSFAQRHLYHLATTTACLARSDAKSKIYIQTHLKVVLLCALIFLLAQSAKASAPLCGDTVEIITNCTMMTPTMLSNCSTYNIITPNGTVAESETPLTLVNGAIYSFDFTLPQGDYLVRLCDGTTREVHALPRDRDMIGITIIFGLMLFFGLGLTVYFAALKSPLSNLFLFMTVLFMDVIMFIAARMAEDQAATWASVLWTVFYVMLVLTFGLLVFFVIFLTKRAAVAAQNKKDDKMKEMYGAAWRL